jgi:hypothetical protein
MKWLWMGLLLSCAGAAPMKPGNLTAPEPITFVRGAAIGPELTAWLDQQQGIVRLPVFFQLAGPRRIEAARVGTIALSLDDSGLGVSLADRTHQHCPKGSGTCTLWIEGRWKGGGTLWVRRVDRAVTEGEAIDFAEVESAR